MEIKSPIWIAIHEMLCIRMPTSQLNDNNMINISLQFHLHLFSQHLTIMYIELIY